MLQKMKWPIIIFLLFCFKKGVKQNTNYPKIGQPLIEILYENLPLTTYTKVNLRISYGHGYFELENHYSIYAHTFSYIKSVHKSWIKPVFRSRISKGHFFLSTYSWILYLVKINFKTWHIKIHKYAMKL